MSACPLLLPGLLFKSVKAVRAITEPDAAEDLLRAVDKYFTLDAIIIHPMFSVLDAIPLWDLPDLLFEIRRLLLVVTA